LSVLSAVPFRTTRRGVQFAAGAPVANADDEIVIGGATYIRVWHGAAIECGRRSRRAVY